MLPLKTLHETDPLLRKAEKALDQEEYSPMDPPDAYNPPSASSIGYEDMHPYLQGLMDEHKDMIETLDAFEATLDGLQKQGLNHTYHDEITQFFRQLDEVMVSHNMKEEKVLFPLLQKRMLESGDHSKGEVQHTAVDLLEDDHIKLMQLAAISFNFIGLAGRLPDGNSAAMTLDAGLEQGKVLVEQLRLHIFREDTIVFPIAQQKISTDEFDAFLEA